MHMSLDQLLHEVVIRLVVGGTRHIVVLWLANI